MLLPFGGEAEEWCQAVYIDIRCFLLDLFLFLFFLFHRTEQSNLISPIPGEGSVLDNAFCFDALVCGDLFKRIGYSSPSVLVSYAKKKSQVLCL